MASRPFTLRLPDEVRNDLKFLSTSTNRPQATIAADFLKEKVTVQARRIKMIQEAKLEAQQGVFISQDAMEQWVDSLGTAHELPMPEPDVFSDPVLTGK